MDQNEKNILMDYMRIQALLTEYKLTVVFESAVKPERVWHIPELGVTGASVGELLYCLLGYDRGTD